VRRLFFICFFLSSCIFFGQSVNIYVSKSGSNSSGDGSGSNPYLTVQYAVNQCVSGDTIQIGPGVYEEEIEVDKKLSIKGSGVESTKLYLDVANYQYKKLMWVRSDTINVSNLTMSTNCDFNYLIYSDTSLVELNYVLLEQTDSTEGGFGSNPYH